MKHILFDRYFSLTNDSWTSVAYNSYTTCTAHFIDKDTWELHSPILGIHEKDGSSIAVVTVDYVEHQMSLFDLQYGKMVAVVTDTEATMISAGQMFVENRRVRGSVTKWHGCVDYLLELVTGIAFKDLPESHGTMSSCRPRLIFLILHHRPWPSYLQSRVSEELLSLYKMFLPDGGLPFLWLIV